MCPGFNGDPQAMDDLRKTAVIDRELHRLCVDVASLQETRLADDGTLREQNYTFFWQGKKEEELRIRGVGFAVKNSLLSTLEPPTGGNERLLNLKMSTRTGVVNLVCAYAPTLCSTADEKTKSTMPLTPPYVACPARRRSSSWETSMLGPVGADWEAWPSIIGHHGIGKMNENGQRLLELCSFHNLEITSTFFEHKDKEKVSWRHPRSKHWHQLDMILYKTKDLNSVKDTRSMHSAECDTDHILVRSKINLTPRKMHHSKTQSLPRINASRASCKFVAQRLQEALRTSLGRGRGDATTAGAKWEQVRTALYQSGLETLGRKEHCNVGWFEANWEEMEPVVEAKRAARLAHEKNPCQATRDALRAARSMCQQTARGCANDYWIKLSQRIQDADFGNTGGMYAGIKEATGPTITKSVPLKTKSGENITDKKEQMER